MCPIVKFDIDELFKEEAPNLYFPNPGTRLWKVLLLAEMIFKLVETAHDIVGSPSSCVFASTHQWLEQSISHVSSFKGISVSKEIGVLSGI
jgi:hypothetical protein